MTFDLAVAYRVYPGLSGTPFVRADGKLPLASLCFDSFVRGLGSLRAKLFLILDGCPPEFEQAFRARFDGPIVVAHLPGVGNRKTFARQVTVLSEQRDAAWVYFAEDDYVYRPGALQTTLEFLATRGGNAFASAYDHPDYYSRIHLHAHRFRVESAAGAHWRTAVYTCLTFMTSARVLNRYRRTLEAFERGAMDNSLWMAITKFNVLNPYRMLKYAVRDRRFLFPTCWDAYRFSWRQVLFGRRAELWTPIPALATHVERATLAPGVDWLEVLDRRGT